jgi:hypothetical protein
MHIDRASFVQFALKKIPWRPDPKIGIVGDFQRPAARPF